MKTHSIIISHRLLPKYNSTKMCSLDKTIKIYYIFIYFGFMPTKRKRPRQKHEPLFLSPHNHIFMDSVI